MEKFDEMRASLANSLRGINVNTLSELLPVVRQLIDNVEYLEEKINERNSHNQKGQKADKV